MVDPGASILIDSSEPLSLDEPKERREETHIPELDGMRGIAALAVVLCHVAQRTVMHSAGNLHKLLDLCLSGFLGVDVFFALSGFLITRILLKRNGQEHYYRNFYIRRFLRLAPCYLIMLALVWVLVPSSGRFLLLSLAYGANFAVLLHIPFSYPVLWSLSVEEHFYLAWPSVIKFLQQRTVVMVCLLICIASPMVRIFEASRGGFDAYLSWYRFDGMAWGALLGIAIYSGWVTSRRQRMFTAALFASLLVLVASCACYRHNKQLGIALFYSAVPMFSIVLIGLAATKTRNSLAILRTPILRFFGDISYWVYLSHYLALDITMEFLRGNYPALIQHGGWRLWFAVFAATLVPSVITGVAVRGWVELPALRLKSKVA